jgi:hypothetical protein
LKKSANRYQMEIRGQPSYARDSGQR